MKRSLLTTYRVGWQDGCDAALANRFSTALAMQDAHLYVDLAVRSWGLTPRAGVHIFDAYHRGFIRGGTCEECAPLSVTPPPAVRTR